MLVKSSTLYRLWHDSDLFVCEAYFICRFFWDPTHCVLHETSVEVSDCSVSIPRNLVTPLGTLTGANTGQI